MKKTPFLFITIALGISLIFNTFCVFAQGTALTISVEDSLHQGIVGDIVGASDNIYIKGEANPGELLLITIVRPGEDLSLASDSNASDIIYYADDTYADENGQWTEAYSFSSCPTGEYLVKVTSEVPSRNVSKTLTVINAAEQNSTIAAINSAADWQGVATVFINSDGARNLMFDTTAFDRLSVSGQNINLVFQKFYNESSQDPLRLTPVSNLNKYEEIFKSYSVLALFNEQKSAAVIREFPSVFNLSSVSGVSQTISYITDGAKKDSCLSALEKNTYSSFDALRKDYGAFVCMKAVECAQWTGFHTIISANSQHFDTLDMTTYGLLNDKSAISRYMKEKAYTNKAAFISGFNTKVSELYDAQNSPSQGGGSFSTGPSGTDIGGGNFGLPSPVPDTSFLDIASVPWAKDAIEHLQQRGIISGTAPNRFEPERQVKREEFVKMFVLLSGIYDSDAVCNFDDVPAMHWSYSYIASAVNGGIIGGIGADIFGLGADISRQDACVIIARAMKDLQEGDKAAEFTDSYDISDYAKDAVEFMASLGIINGNDDGSFKPLKGMTRAEAAKVLYGLSMIIGG